jgi:hypothetical protein
MAPSAVPLQLSGVTDIRVGEVPGWVMTSSRRIPLIQVTMITKVTKITVLTKATVVCSHIEIKVDRKVTQPILEYLLMIAIQYNSIGLINTHIAMTILVQDPTQVMPSCNLLAPVRQLSSNS